jgi:endo-1,4-beta-xylanase
VKRPIGPSRPGPILVVALSLPLLAACGGDAGVGASPTPTPQTLRDLSSARGIHWGAMYQYSFGGGVYDRVFENEMNAMTATMYWTWVTQPNRREEYLFDETDAKVAWGEARQMEIHGHVLVWYQDIPDWLKATPVRDVEAIMNEHIDRVVGRYAGRVHVWDVVNEAVDDGDGSLRVNHKWAEAMGTDYIAKAFRRAHAADPTATLRYNDYWIESNEVKFAGVRALLRGLLDRGVPVNALGWQMHIQPFSFDPAVLLGRMNEIADMGLDNYITELDVEIPANASSADYESQKATYRSVVDTFLAARRHTTIVTWGLRDGDPYWLTNGHPLLFDEGLARKKAYDGVREGLAASP